MAGRVKQSVTQGAAASVQGPGRGYFVDAMAAPGSVELDETFFGVYLQIQAIGGDVYVWFHDDATSTNVSADSSAFEDEVALVAVDGVINHWVVPAYTGNGKKAYLHWAATAGTPDLRIVVG